jgi:hypothetical protein
VHDHIISLVFDSGDPGYRPSMIKLRAPKKKPLLSLVAISENTWGNREKPKSAPCIVPSVPLVSQNERKKCPGLSTFEQPLGEKNVNRSKAEERKANRLPP